MINHSPRYNAQATCIFDRGHEHAVILASEFIPKGGGLVDVFQP